MNSNDNVLLTLTEETIASPDYIYSRLFMQVYLKEFDSFWMEVVASEDYSREDGALIVQGFRQLDNGSIASTIDSSSFTRNLLYTSDKK